MSYPEQPRKLCKANYSKILKLHQGGIFKTFSSNPQEVKREKKKKKNEKLETNRKQIIVRVKVNIS